MEDTTVINSTDQIGEVKVADQSTETPKVPTPAPAPTIDHKELESIQKKAFGYAFNMMDEALKEMGYEKPDNVKTTDYVKQILSDKGTKPSEESVKQTDTESEARIKALQDQLKEKEAKLVELSESTNKQKRDFFLNSLISTAEIQAPDGLGEAEKARYIERIKRTMSSELQSNYQIREVGDSYKLYSKDGEPIFDGTPDMNIIDPVQLIKRDFSEFLTAPKVTKSVVKGTGSNETNEKVNVGRSFPSTVKTKDDLYDHIASQGLKLGTKEFSTEVLKAKQELPHLFK
jgi:hypothetical protein